MIKELQFEAVCGSQRMQITIAQPHQKPEMGLHLYENNYYCGILEKKDGYWTAHLNDKSLEYITGDDITILGQIIDQSKVFEFE